MQVLTWPTKILKRVQQHGLLSSFRYALIRLEEVTFDLRYGVKTARGSLPQASEDQNGFGYWPALSCETRRMLSLLQIGQNTDVLLDFGSGLGRVLILAAQYPFKRIIGVECGHELHQLAQKNIGVIRPAARCREIELVCQDAREYRIPGDVNIVYFNEPFGEEVLLRVFDNIRDSLLANPRELTLVYRFPRTFSKVFPRVAWLEQVSEHRLLFKHVVCRARLDCLTPGREKVVGS